jgi:hypothetical protein
MVDGMSTGLLADDSPHSGQGQNAAVLWSAAAAASMQHAEGLEVPAIFRVQPRPLDARRRVAYRTALLVLVLSHFNGSAAKINNVHLFMWATRTRRTRRMLSAWWAGRRFATTQIQRVDPDLQITIGLAYADGLIGVRGQGGQRIQLTERGEQFARAIDQTPDLLSLEKEFLSSFPRLSDAAVSRNLSAGVV